MRVDTNVCQLSSNSGIYGSVIAVMGQTLRMSYK